MTEQRIRLEGIRKQRMETARNRLMVAVFLFAGIFGLLTLRMLDLGLIEGPRENTLTASGGEEGQLVQRADIVDRNGVILATNLETASLYADPKTVLDPQEAAARLVTVLHDLSQAEVEEKLSSERRFVWLKRKLTPTQMWQVNALGIPGLSFRMEEERVYPQGRLAAHALGYVDVDGNGLAGLEHFFDDRLQEPTRVDQPLQTSLDIRVQHALTDELRRTVDMFQAKGAAGVVLDVRTGEVLALASLPDFNPNVVDGVTDDQMFNRVSQGVYELGSIFKIITVANALDDGLLSLADGYDATSPIQVGRFVIHDDHPQERFLTVPEIIAYSSNIAAAKMALDIGGVRQREFLGQLGLLRPANVELTEVGQPIWPVTWRDINTMTISYGHGIAVSPLQLASGIAAMVNGGNLIPATIIKQDQDASIVAQQVISPQTSAMVRELMRVSVTKGTGKSANVAGYRVGGKTGTAEKSGVGGYNEKALVSSFAGVFPMDDPRYLVLVAIDEPVGTEATFNYATAGWVAAPLAGRVIARIAPIMGVEPVEEDKSLTQRVSLLVTEE